MSTAFQAWAESFWRKNGRYPMQHEVWEAASQRTEQQAGAAEPFGYFIELERETNPKAGPVYLGGAPKEIMEQARSEGDGEPFPLFAHPPAAEPKGMEPVDAARVCKWTYQDDPTYAWATQCGQMHVITDGTPAENDFKFCCYCGGKLDQSGEAA